MLELPTFFDQFDVEATMPIPARSVQRALHYTMGETGATDIAHGNMANAFTIDPGEAKCSSECC